MASQAVISHADNGIAMQEMDAPTLPARRAGRLPYGRGLSASPRPRRGRNPPPGTWDRERIVAALRDWREAVGVPPRSYDWSPPLARALGRESARSRRWNVEHPRWPHAQTVFAHWGSWSAALVAAGLPATVREFDMPWRTGVAAARRLAAEGTAQTRIAARLGSAVSPRTVRNYLQAGDCAVCGTPLAAPQATHCRSCAGRVRAAPRWSAPEILKAMRRWERETGLQPTVRSWARDTARSRSGIGSTRRGPAPTGSLPGFGSWREALRMAGFAPLKRAWSREEVIAVRQHAARDEDRSPRQTEWMRATAQRPAASTVRNLFGTWQAALHAAGIAPEG
jgi:Homing endonuclease associated repeat